MQSRPLSEGNALQRRCAAWARPHCAGTIADLRTGIERSATWLYSRVGPRFWLGLLGAQVAALAGWLASGVPGWLTPVCSGVIGLSLLLLGAVAHGQHVQSRHQLQELRLVHDHDAGARLAAEAQLRLLQGQIQPHFIFNTLATVQHWVDTADPRAGPLLHALTGYLRGSTELLGREQTTLADEAAMVESYLQIMQARLGTRLRYRLGIEPAVAHCSLPPGLMLTLVENAVEHGVSPSLDGASIHVLAQADGTGWRLRVIDDGAGLNAGWSEGLGLANGRRRLQHQFGARASLVLTALQPGTEACIEVNPGAEA